MCSPLIAAAATTVVSAGSALANYFGTQSAHHAAVSAANLNFNEKFAQASSENAQLGQRQSEDSLTNAVEEAKAQGQIAASAGSMGLGAYSAHQYLSASAAAYNRTMGITDRNYQTQRANLQTELRGASIQRSSDLAAAPRTNLGALALNLAGSAAQGASTYGSLGGRFGVKPAGGPA